MNPPSSSYRAPRPHLAVVLGGGLAGMLAAAVLSEHAEVFVVERDHLPEGPSPRKGLPQARHAHLLWSGGARAVEKLLPGTVQRLQAAGARRVALPSGLVVLAPYGWMRRWPEMQHLIACSRDLTDWVVREEVLSRPGITLLEGAEVVDLAGTAQHVTGVHVRDSASGGVRRLDADLVVDATGRGSAAPEWLSALGLPPVREEVVDSGLAYASRVFRAPAGAENHPVVSVQCDARLPVPGQAATLLPIENGRWLVTLAGTRGGRPSKKADEFESFARNLRHPLIADLIAGAEPLTEVHHSHSTLNRRRRFERMASWPTGFVVLGDAVAAFNPIYGQGMSVAALCAEKLRDALERNDMDEEGLARCVQRAIGRIVHGPWELAVGQDIQYPGAIGPRPPAATAPLRHYMERLAVTAMGRPAVMRAYLEVLTLSAPFSRLFGPTVALGVLRGPGRRPLNVPPLTESERAGGYASRRSAPSPAEKNLGPRGFC